MSSPSLVFVPARYKATKLYTQYPTDGSADFIVSQASGNATRVNASGFVEAVSANIPRIDYRNVAQSIDCPALLVEPAATNLAFDSQTWATGTNWTLTNATTLTGTTGTIDPFGTNTANAISPTTAAGTHVVESNFPTLGSRISYTSGTIYTQSGFFKQGTGAAGRYVQITFGARFSQNGYANFDLQAGAVVASGGTADTNRAASIENYGNGWYRCRLTATCTQSGLDQGLIAVLITSSGSTRLPSFTGVTGDVLYGWGAQVETGSVATSYIPTTTAALTRDADTIYASGAVSGTIGQASGTIYAEVDMRNWSASGRVVAISDGTQDSCMVIHVNADRSFTVFMNASSVNQLTMQTVSGLYNGVHRVAFAYKKDDFAFYLNGALVSSHTNGTVPATNHLYVGKIETSGSTDFLNDRVRAVALFKTKLSDSDLSILTGIDYTDLTWNTYTTRTSLSTELPTCLLTRYFELINV